MRRRPSRWAEPSTRWSSRASAPSGSRPIRTRRATGIKKRQNSDRGMRRSGSISSPDRRGDPENRDPKSCRVFGQAQAICRGAGPALQARGGTAVGAAPAAVAPRQIPPRSRRRRVGDEVEAGGAERLAAQHARERHPSAGPEAMACEGLVGILRAGRQVSAVQADERRQGQAIGLHRRPGEDLRRARPRSGSRRNLRRRFHRHRFA